MNIKWILITSTLMALHFQVQADQESDQKALRERASHETTWQAVDVQIAGLHGTIKGFLTDNGKTKLDYIDGGVQSDTTIKANEFKRYRNQDEYLNECQANVSSYPSYRALKIPYQLMMPILAGKTSALATEFQGIEYFKVHVQVGSGSFFLQSGDLDGAKLEKDLQFQLTNKQDQIQKTGQVVLDLTGLDDVVCDLVAGHVTIGVEVRVHYSAAKLARLPIMSSDDASRIAESIRRGWQGGEDPRRNLVLGSGRLGVAVEARATTMSPLQDWQFVRLHSQLFTEPSYDLKALADGDFENVARAMDLLAEQNTYSTPIFQTKVASPFQPGRLP